MKVWIYADTNTGIIYGVLKEKPVLCWGDMASFLWFYTELEEKIINEIMRRKWKIDLTKVSPAVQSFGNLNKSIIDTMQRNASRTTATNKAGIMPSLVTFLSDISNKVDGILAEIPELSSDSKIDATLQKEFSDLIERYFSHYATSIEEEKAKSDWVKFGTEPDLETLVPISLIPNPNPPIFFGD